jgi:hypothetical protein
VRIVVRTGAAVAALAVGLGAWTPYAVAEPVDLGGRPVDGSTDSAQPAPLGAGLWTVMLGPESQAQFFTYERQIEDSTIHVGAMGAPAGPDGDGLELAATVAATEGTDPVDCGTDTVSTDSSAPYGLIGGHVIVGDEEDSSTTTPCRAAGTVDIKLTRYSGANSGDLPVAVKVVEEAPVSDPGAPPPESEELDYVVPERADPASTPAGASSLDDAPAVDAHDGPVTIDTPIAEGTELLWRVPLEWGDELVARVDLPALPAGDAEGLGYPSVYVKVAIIQPSRNVFVLTGEDSSYGYYGTPERSRLVAATYPLRYTNRYSSDVDPVLPGDHWVSVTVAAAPEGEEPLDVPMELTLEATRTDAPAPTYKDAVLAQGGGAGPDGYSPATPYLVGDGEFSAVASGNPFTDGEADDEWWGPRRGVGLGVGVVSLACCAVGAVWLTRRRAR